MRFSLTVLCCAFLSACGGGTGDDAPIAISLIGPPLKLIDPNRSTPDKGAALMLSETAQGLVAFDAAGQVEPALAERWIMTDDGLSFIFRIGRTQWADGSEVSAAQVASRLQAALAPGSVNRLKPLFSGVDRVIAMTGQVVEIRLKRSEPDLLQLLAQPDMALFKTKPTLGTGPYRVHSSRAGITRLRPVADATLGDKPVDVRHDVRVRAEAAAPAIARFVARDVALVTGGSFADLPLARAARPANSQFQVDPVYGLFGFSVSAASTTLATVELRRALAMAIDRDRALRLFGVAGWRPQLSLLPVQMDSANPPAVLEWVQLGMEARRARARSLVAAAGGDVVVRVAMPAGAGSRLLFAALAADWRQIGVTARMVPINAPADLRLVDEVAPQSSALWYLVRTSCARGLPCSDKGEAALRAAYGAQNASDEAAAIAETDAAFASTQSFIPIALPLRWSLVAPQLTGWRKTAFHHPLRRLRGE